MILDHRHANQLLSEMATVMSPCRSFSGGSKEMNAEFKAQVDALQSKVDPATEPLDTVSVRPKKTNITIRLVALAWNKP